MKLISLHRDLKGLFLLISAGFRRQFSNGAYKIIFVLALFVLVPFSVDAASLYFSPSSNSPAVGSTFTVSIFAGSSDQAMNAASGVVSFQWDKMEVVSLSKTGSVFSLWAEEPSFSNSAGTVSFEGIVLNPGFTGPSGKILTITFRAKREGQANLSFSSGSVLANDGSGTNILSDLRMTVLTLTNQQEIQTTAGEIRNTLGITSSTHGDQTKWYVNNTPEFSWELPPGTLEARTLIGKSSMSVPTVSYTPAISKKKVDELPDGIYYFSLQVRTAAGWSDVSRYRVNVDTIPPKPFSITFPHGNKGFEPQPIILFNTTDGESGISHYNISIGDNDKLERVAPVALNNQYVLPSQYPGTYTLSVTAVDNAGNTRSASSEFTIEGIDAPTITYYPDKIESGDIVKIRGMTYPNADISIYIREGDKIIGEEYTKSNALGDFVLVVSKRLDFGTYTFTARVTDDKGAKSNETSPLTIEVSSKFISGLIDNVLNYLSALILALLVLGGIALVGVRLWFKIPNTIRRMRREAQEAEKISERAFHVLRKDIKTHIERLKAVKRKLTVEEVVFLEQFEKDLGEAEDIVTKEIQDISNS